MQAALPQTGVKDRKHVGAIHGRWVMNKKTKINIRTAHPNDYVIFRNNGIMRIISVRLNMDLDDCTLILSDLTSKYTYSLSFEKDGSYINKHEPHVLDIVGVMRPVPKKPKKVGKSNGKSKKSKRG